MLARFAVTNPLFQKLLSANFELEILTTLMNSLNHSQILAALISLQLHTNNFTGVPDNFCEFSQLTYRLLYFNHPVTELLREFRAQSGENRNYMDKELMWSGRIQFYNSFFNLDMANEIINYYQILQKKGVSVPFNEYCDMIEELLLTRNLILMLREDSPYHDLYELDLEKERVRIPPEKLQECLQLIYKGYRNKKTFMFNTDITDIEASNVFVADTYAFDINELLQREQSEFYINPHTNREFTAFAKSRMQLHPKLIDKVNVMEQQSTMAAMHTHLFKTSTDNGEKNIEEPMQPNKRIHQ